jgi:hypothetical protein
MFKVQGSIACGVQLPVAFNCLRRSRVQLPVAFNCLWRSRVQLPAAFKSQSKQSL